MPRRASADRRDPLNRKTIVAAAVRILDAGGLDGFTMRRVADALDTGPASLYWHVGQHLSRAADRAPGVTLDGEPVVATVRPCQFELGRLVEATEIGTGTVERLELAVDELAIAYPSTPSADLYARVRGYLSYVSQLLDARMTLAEHRRLLVVSGWMSLLAATTLIDLHRDYAAAAHLRTAAQLAREAGHAEIVGWCLENPSLAGADRGGLPAGH